MRENITPFSQERALGYLYSLAEMLWPGNKDFIPAKSGENSHTLVNEYEGVILQMRQRFKDNFFEHHASASQELFPWPNFPTPRVLMPYATLRYFGNDPQDEILDDRLETVIYVSPYLEETDDREAALEIFNKLFNKNLDADIDFGTDFDAGEPTNIGLTCEHVPIIYDMHAPRVMRHKDPYVVLRALLNEGRGKIERFSAQLNLWEEMGAQEIIKNVLTKIPEDFPFQVISTLNLALLGSKTISRQLFQP